MSHTTSTQTATAAIAAKQAEKTSADKAERQVFEVSVDYSQISRVVLRPLFCAGENLPHQLVGPTLNFLSAILHCPGASRLYVSELVPTGDTRQKTVRFRRGRALELTLSALRALETLFSDLGHDSSPADGQSAAGDAEPGAPTSGSALLDAVEEDNTTQPAPEPGAAKVCRFCDIDGKPPCGTASMGGSLLCTRAGGHYGDHVSCDCGHHNLFSWERDHSEAERYHALLIEILNEEEPDSWVADQIREQMGIE